MQPRKIGIGLAFIATIIIAGFAINAVRQFANKPARLNPVPMQTPVSTIEDPYTPDVVPVSQQERDELHLALESSALRALREINPAHRPPEAAARAIAAVFAEFVTVCSTGTPEDHVAMVQSRGREPDKRFLDPQRKDGFWNTNTGWAREASLGVDGIWARPRFIRGVAIPIDPSRIRDGGGTIRRLADGKLSSNDTHDRTVFEIIIPATLASVDGVREQGAIGIHIANDAPNGGWDTLAVFALGVPQGFMIFLTPP
jgi:hypothetical protein